MRNYTFYRGYTLADPRFYEDLSYFISEGDLEERVNRLASARASCIRRGPWIVCRPDGRPLVDQGWKIHVSTVPDHAAPALEAVLAEFAHAPFHFKCLRDRRLVVAATSRWWRPGQVGKVIAIYPESAEDCRALLARLQPVLKEIEGPYILTDRRYRDSSCLFYRYGGFVSKWRVEPDGTRSSIVQGPAGEEWTDDRTPVYRKPPWVGDLFPEQERRPASRTILGYQVSRALHHTGTGGLYLAERVSDGTVVVLKESRPHTAFATDGSSGQDRLRREFERLTRLAGTGVGPEPVELFRAWEHLFLAQEHIDHGTLISFLSARNPLANGDLAPDSLATYRAEAETVLAGLRRAIATCHERGICYGDVSLTNILIEPETLKVRLVDFESSKPFNQWHGDTPASPGFRPPPGSKAWDDPRAFDEFGAACAELAILSPRNVLRELNPDALARSIRHAAELLQYPLGDLLERVELPPGHDEDPPDLDGVVREAVRFIENTLTPDRTDRLFPAAPEVYVSNPWSVAHGVAGLIRGLHRLTGQVPTAVSEWMSRNLASLDQLPPSLYFGWSGVGWTLLDVGETGRGLELIDRASAKPLPDQPASVAVGTAGVALACLAAWQGTKDDGWRERATEIGDHLIGTAHDSGQGLYWPEPESRHQPLGYAYGSSGVAALLLYLHFATGESRFLAVARRALNFDLKQVTTRARTGIGLPGHADLPLLEPYWQRGSAGFGGVLARFVRATREEQLDTTLDRLVRSTLPGTTINPGLFSGMAGLINFALDCHHLLGRSDYRQLTTDLTGGILALRCPQPEGLAFPGHGLLRYCNDFASGSVGIALVLHRLQHGGPDFNYTLDELLPEPRNA